MFLNSSIGISEGVRATLFLRDCRKRNIIHRGGVDIKWNGPVPGPRSGTAPRSGVYDQMEQLFTNQKFHFCYHRNFRVFFLNGKRPQSLPHFYDLRRALPLI